MIYKLTTMFLCAAVNIGKKNTINNYTKICNYSRYAIYVVCIQTSDTNLVKPYLFFMDYPFCPDIRCYNFW